ncbi:hypothetical protein Tco_0445360, partial [Tanacetum coccineum]
MAPETFTAVVPAKFDMHVYRSELTSDELKKIVVEHCIPSDLRPCLPHPDMTMNKLSAKVIRFEVRCRSLNISPTVSLFRVFYKLCKQGHWFSFENKIDGRAKKCFKEVTTSLKGWKKKFFIIDRRAIPDVMPWRHGDTNLRDDFSTNYNVNDASCLSEFIILLRPTPCHLLYECGLTTACRHPELAYNIKYKDGNVIDMDAFLKLPKWTGTFVSKGDPIPENQRPKLRTTPPLPVNANIPEKTVFQKNLEKPNLNIIAAREKSEQKSLARAAAKRAASRKKRKVCKNQEDIGSGTEETLSPTPLRQAALAITKEPVIPTVANVPKEPLEINREVVNLSRDTSPALAHRVSPSPKQHDTREHATSDTHSFHSSHHQDADESTLVLRYMPNWDLWNDLRVCTFRACKELVSHLTTPAKDEFLGDLWNHNDVNVTELGDLRSSLQREKQANADLSNEFALLDSAHAGCSDREKEFMDRLKDMEKDRDEWRQIASDQVERIRSLEGGLVLASQQLAVEREK